MPGIGVINNPNSRKNRRYPEWMDGLGYIVGTSGKSVATKNLTDLREIARIFKEEGIEVLAINGGDGSNSVTLTTFIQEYGKTPMPKISFLRGGTMNTTANGCGIKGSPAGIMMNLVHKIREGIPFDTIFRDTLNAEGRYGFIMGTGLVNSFMRAYYAANPTPWGAVKVVSRAAGSALVGGRFAAKLVKPLVATVTVDGQVWPHKSYTAVIAATVISIGLKFKPFFRCEESPHSFHLLGILARPMGIVTAMPKVFFGKKVSDKKMAEAVARRVVMEAEEPMEFNIDGEFVSCGHRLELGVGPRLEIVIR